MAGARSLELIRPSDVPLGEIVEAALSRPRRCYLVRKTDAGSVPCSAFKGQMAKTGDIFSGYRTESNRSPSCSLTSPCQRGTRTGASSLGSESTICITGSCTPPRTLFASSHCRMVFSENRRFLTNSRCGMRLRSRSIRSVNRCAGRPVASIISFELIYCSSDSVASEG